MLLRVGKTRMFCGIGSALGRGRYVPGPAGRNWEAPPVRARALLVVGSRRSLDGLTRAAQPSKMPP